MEKEGIWTQKEIRKVAGIIHKAEKNKHILIKFLDELVHWLIVLVVFIGNFIISSFLVVISMMVTKHVFYIVLVLLGFVSALLIEVPLKEIEKLNMHKFLFLRVILPLLALVNIAVFMSLKVLFENMTGMGLYFNPIIAGVAYGIVFVLPHIAASFNR